MNILIVTNYAPPHTGGIEIVAYEQAVRLARRGHTVSWLTSRIPRTTQAREIVEGVTIERFSAVNWLERYGVPYPVFYPGFLGHVSKQVEQADVVHVHGMLYEGSSSAIRTAKRAGKKTVMTCHVIDRARGLDGPGHLVQKLRNILTHQLERWAHAHVGTPNLRACDAVVVYNDAVQAFVQSVLGDVRRVHHIPNGVDTVRFHPPTPEQKRAAREKWGLPQGEVVIGFMGRLVPRKGGHFVVRGSPKGSVVFVVGDGALPSGNGEATVRHIPAQPREYMPELLQTCDILALPSVGEGFPLVVQEAMATGLAVVLGNDPGYAPYGIYDELRLVEPAEYSVCVALAELAGDGALRAQMGANARAYAVSRFDWEHTIDAYLDLYRSILSNGESR